MTNFINNQLKSNIMLSSFLKSGLSSLQSMSIISAMQNDKGQKQSVQAAQSQAIQKIVQDTLNALSTILSQRLGQQISGQDLKQLSSEILASKQLQTSLLQVKEKYNELASKSGKLYQEARKISLCLVQFLSNVNLFLQSQEMMIPVSQIQKGVNQLNSDKVQKQFNYLIKIFTQNYQEVIDRNVNHVEKSLKQEIRVLKGLHKNLQGEIVNIKNYKHHQEGKLVDQALKVTALNDRIKGLCAEKVEMDGAVRQSNSLLQQKLRLISEQDVEIKKMRVKELELLQKLKKLEIKSMRTDRMVKERGTEAEELNMVIEKLKQRQDQVVQQVQGEFKKRLNTQEHLLKKVYNQKAILEERVERLKEKVIGFESQLKDRNDEVVILKGQIDKFKDTKMMEIDLDNIANTNGERTQKISDCEGENVSKETPPHRMTLQELMTRMDDLEHQNKQIQGILAKQRGLNVNRQVLSSLFLSYDDESKEWSIRRNIKYQIYSLLGLQQKLPKPEESKQGKWFGLF